jgi:hypothetical protein
MRRGPVEGRHAIAMLGGVIQNLAQRNECHEWFSRK